MKHLGIPLMRDKWEACPLAQIERKLNNCDFEVRGITISSIHAIYTIAEALGMAVPITSKTVPLPEFPEFKCTWGTINGRSTETLMIQGPNNPNFMIVVQRIVTALGPSNIVNSTDLFICLSEKE